MKTTNCLENKSVLFDYTEAEELDNQNCLERNSEVIENKILWISKKLTDAIDNEDGIYGNNIRLNKLRDLINTAIRENQNQYQKNLKQQEILDRFVDFPEKLPERSL